MFAKMHHLNNDGSNAFNCIASLLVVITSLLARVLTPMRPTMLFEYYDVICIIQYAAYGSIIVTIVTGIHENSSTLIALHPSNYAKMIIFNVILIIFEQIGQPAEFKGLNNLDTNAKFLVLFAAVMSIIFTIHSPRSKRPMVDICNVIHGAWHSVNWVRMVELYLYGSTSQGIPMFIAVILQHFLAEPHRIKDEWYFSYIGPLCIGLSSMYYNEDMHAAMSFHLFAAITYQAYLLKKYKGVWFIFQDPEINLDEYIPPLNGMKPIAYYIIAKIHYGIMIIMHCMLQLLQDKDISEWKDLRCDNCKVSFEKLRKCRRCQNVRYCSRECQKISWKYVHRYHCKSPC